MTRDFDQSSAPDWPFQPPNPVHRSQSWGEHPNVLSLVGCSWWGHQIQISGPLRSHPSGEARAQAMLHCNSEVKPQCNCCSIALQCSDCRTTLMHHQLTMAWSSPPKSSKTPSCWGMPGLLPNFHHTVMVGHRSSVCNMLLAAKRGDSWFHVTTESESNWATHLASKALVPSAVPNKWQTTHKMVAQLSRLSPFPCQTLLQFATLNGRMREEMSSYEDSGHTSWIALL
jgi:hypothetical protein